jgi:hypothetical protein
VTFEGQEVTQRTRAQGREQLRPRLHCAGVSKRRAGLDEGDHVAAKAGVVDLLAVQHADPRTGAGVVGHELHRLPASSAAARRRAATIFT